MVVKQPRKSLGAAIMDTDRDIFNNKFVPSLRLSNAKENSMATNGVDRQLDSLSFKLFLLGELFKKQKISYQRQIAHMLKVQRSRDNELLFLKSQNRFLCEQLLQSYANAHLNGLLFDHPASKAPPTYDVSNIPQVYDGAESNAATDPDHSHPSVVTADRGSDKTLAEVKTKTVPPVNHGTAFREKIVVKFNSFSIRRGKTGKYAILGELRKNFQNSNGGKGCKAHTQAQIPSEDGLVGGMSTAEDTSERKLAPRSGSLLLKFRRSWGTAPKNVLPNVESAGRKEQAVASKHKRGTLTSLFSIEEEMFQNVSMVPVTLVEGSAGIRRGASTTNLSCASTKLRAVLSLKLLPLATSTTRGRGALKRHSTIVS